MKENKTKPDIRFKGFTEAWEQRKVSKITKFHKQGFYTIEDYNDNKKYYLLRGTDFSENKLLLKDTPKINATKKDYEAFKTELGDFLIVRSGTVGTYGIVDVDIPAIFGSYLIDFRFDMEQVTNEFFGYFYQSDLFKSQLNKIIQTSANTNINAENIKSTVISLPNLDEQRKISEYLGNLDHLITLHQRECDQLKELKKSMLKKMFPRDESSIPEVRFAGFTDAWEQRKLIDLCDYVDYRGKTPNKSDSGIFLVTAKNVKDGYIDYDVSKEYIPEDKYEEVMRRGKPKIGDVLITTEAPCGNVAQVNKPNIALAQRIIKYRGHNQVIDNTYLKYYLLSPFFQNILNMKSSGGTVQGIKGSVLHQQKISFTKYTEQLKIGQCLDSLDSLITLHQRELEILKNLKKTCLKRMFI
ncbi:restriction endonuclease subunit S [Coprobacillus sp. AM28-15LB]|nr:restriction endonuclease subunit S [Coprobacillus sp. AM28-15LB]